MAEAGDQWWKEWFDTPYYHELYQHRDDTEAQQFIRALIKELRPGNDWQFLDLACGRGRHAVYLHQQGYRVHGIDISPANITYARRFADETLSFEVGDMRESMGEERYQCILNLFTSFGYFDRWEENQKACRAIAQALKPAGVFVLDFLNAASLSEELKKKDRVATAQRIFHIEKQIREGQIVKDIHFKTEKGEQHFREQVQLLKLIDFETLFAKAGLKIKSLYGDYDLNPYRGDESERLIILATK